MSYKIKNIIIGISIGLCFVGMIVLAAYALRISNKTTINAEATVVSVECKEGEYIFIPTGGTVYPIKQDDTYTTVIEYDGTTYTFTTKEVYDKCKNYEGSKIAVIVTTQTYVLGGTSIDICIK